MNTITEQLAPCGLDCSRCVPRSGGTIQTAARALCEGLAGFEKMAQLYAAHDTRFSGYGEFSALLDFFAEGTCPGCRNGASCNAGCAAQTCCREKQVAFCFQCDEYPCERNSFNPGLAQKWRMNNDFMKENGIEAFFEMQERNPRYR
jgi:hypothetical protein